MQIIERAHAPQAQAAVKAALQRMEEAAALAVAVSLITHAACSGEASLYQHMFPLLSTTCAGEGDSPKARAAV